MTLRCVRCPAWGGGGRPNFIGLVLMTSGEATGAPLLMVQVSEVVYNASVEPLLSAHEAPVDYMLANTGTVLSAYAHSVVVYVAAGLRLLGSAGHGPGGPGGGGLAGAGTRAVPVAPASTLSAGDVASAAPPPSATMSATASSHGALSLPPAVPGSPGPSGEAQASARASGAAKATATLAASAMPAVALGASPASPAPVPRPVPVPVEDVRQSVFVNLLRSDGFVEVVDLNDGLVWDGPAPPRRPSASHAARFGSRLIYTTQSARAHDPGPASWDVGGRGTAATV